MGEEDDREWNGSSGSSGEVNVGAGRGAERGAGNRLIKNKGCAKCQSGVLSVNASF